MESIYKITYLFVWGMWAVIGFIFWIPLLSRATATLSGAILYSTVTESNPAHIKTSFESAVSFYMRGFKTIENVYSPAEETLYSKNQDKSVESKWWKILIEICWTCLFWGTLFIGISSVVSSGETVSFKNTGNSNYDNGTIFFDKKEYQKAIIEFTLFIEKTPIDTIKTKFIDVYSYRGVSFHRTNNLDAALTDYNKHIELKPNNASSYYNRALIYDEKKNFQLSYNNYKVALKLDNNTLQQKSHETAINRMNELEKTNGISADNNILSDETTIVPKKDN
jgi:tetratricopeptide (TPR) repeat protein